MKKLKIVLALCIAVIIAGVVPLFIDDDLDPVAKKWITYGQDGSVNANDAFYYFIGFIANENDDPLTLGKKLVQAHKASNPEPSSDIGDTILVEYPKTKRLKIHKNEQQCDLTTTECFNKVVLNTDYYNTLVLKNTTLIARYNNFLSMGYIKSDPSFSSEVPYNVIEYLHLANQMIQLRAIALMAKGEYTNSLNILLNSISLLRKQLMSDNFSLKISALVSIRNNITILSRIYNVTPVKDKLTLLDFNQILQPLTSADISLENSMMLSYRPLARYVYYDGWKDLPSGEHYEPTLLERIEIRLLHKKNMTLNQMLIPYKQASDLSNLTTDELDTNWQKLTKSSPEPSMFSYRNYLGNIFANIETPRFVNVAPEYHSLNIEIFLAQIRLSLPAKINEDILDSHINTLATEELPIKNRRPFIDTNENKLCYKVAFADKGRVCIDM